MTRDQVYALVDAERVRQGSIWNRDHDWGHGDCSSSGVAPIVKAVVLAEECGEVARAVLDKNSALLLDELVQTAAVAVAWLESLPKDATKEGEF